MRAVLGDVTVEVIQEEQVKGVLDLKHKNTDVTEGLVTSRGSQVQELKLGDKVSFLTRAARATFIDGATTVMIVNEGNILSVD